MAVAGLADPAAGVPPTSLFAAILSFHNAVARYMVALGRERVLPAALGPHEPRTGASRIASLTQPGVRLAVIVLYALAGWDPMVRLFFWLGTTGAFGVLCLLAVTSIAVVRFFARDPRVYQGIGLGAAGAGEPGRRPRFVAAEDAGVSCRSVSSSTCRGRAGRRGCSCSPW